jgi:hypothetical protein
MKVSGGGIGAEGDSIEMRFLINNLNRAQTAG